MARPAWRQMRRNEPALALLAALGALALFVLLRTHPWQPEPPMVGTAAIVDGDTLRIGTTRIRLIGLDAPELAQTCTGADGADWPCGRQARSFAEQIAGGRTVACVPSGRDRYARVLARCSVEDGDLGREIVGAGWAVADMDYGVEAARARAAHAGIWAGTFTAPAEWRRTHGEAPPSFFDWLRGLF